MKYDDAEWHYAGDFPEELPESYGATHIGMFVAWALMNGMAGELLKEEFPNELERLRNRETTPGQFLINTCDEKFTDEDLSDEGNAFAQAYYLSEEALYLSDYESLFAEAHTTLYHVRDSWANFDQIAVLVDRRFEEWKSGKLRLGGHVTEGSVAQDQKPWWKLW